MKSSLLVLAIALITAACSPNSLEDFRCEGESECRAFAKDLEKIQTREDLIQAFPKIKMHFEKLATLMIEVYQFQKQNETLEENVLRKTEASDLLLVQFERIYEMELGKEIMEKAQKEALYRSDLKIGIK